ncbi:MAG: hypothetical protein K2O89_02245 [Clostridia bacterium]|nr:hypothetical protein [Clostridia bacterium]
MNDILINVISAVVTTVLLPLITWAGTKLIQYIGTKVKNEKTAALLSTATTVVLNAVRSVFQTYVESLKASDSFDSAAQVEALRKAKDIALSQLGDDVKEYITANFGNLDEWLTNQIESSINLLKNL